MVSETTYPMEPVTGFDEEDNVSFKSATEPCWSISGGYDAFCTLLGFDTVDLTNIKQCDCTIKLNDTTIYDVQGVNIYRHNQGIAVNGTTGSNRLSFASGGTDLVRCKVYVTSSAYTFDTANDVVEITLKMPGTPTTTTVLTPISPEFIAGIPANDGTYVLKATVSNGTITVAWVAENA